MPELVITSLSVTNVDFSSIFDQLEIKAVMINL